MKSKHKNFPYAVRIADVPGLPFAAIRRAYPSAPAQNSATFGAFVENEIWWWRHLEEWDNEAARCGVTTWYQVPPHLGTVAYLRWHAERGLVRYALDALFYSEWLARFNRGNGWRPAWCLPRSEMGEAHPLAPLAITIENLVLPAGIQKKHACGLFWDEFQRLEREAGFVRTQPVSQNAHLAPARWKGRFTVLETLDKKTLLRQPVDNETWSPVRRELRAWIKRWTEGRKR
jgi:hypothetical protein